MKRQIDFEKYDINHIIIKPLYLGLVINIIIPAVLIYICYYLENNYNMINKLGDFSFTLFIIICILAVVQSAAAFYLRNQLLNKPLIKSEATFSDDLSSAIMKVSKPMFLMIMLISIYGFIFYLISADFEAAMMIVVFSFVVFQVIRPRLGFAKKLIEKQEDYVEQGKFAEQ